VKCDSVLLTTKTLNLCCGAEDVDTHFKSLAINMSKEHMSKSVTQCMPS
jgi:hypothetical protein